MVSEAAFFGPSYTDVCEGSKTSANLRRTYQGKGREALFSYLSFCLFIAANGLVPLSTVFVHKTPEKGHRLATTSVKTVHKEIALCSNQPDMMGTMDKNIVGRTEPKRAKTDPRYCEKRRFDTQDTAYRPRVAGRRGDRAQKMR